MPVKLQTNIAALKARRPQILALCKAVLNSPIIETKEEDRLKSPILTKNADRLLALLNTIALLNTNEKTRLTDVARRLIDRLDRIACDKDLQETDLMAAVDLVCDLSRPGRFLLLATWLTWALQGWRLRCPPRWS